MNVLTSGRTSFSLLWSGDFTGTEDPLGRGIQRLRSPGTIVLGALVGTAEFEGDILRARICKIENLLEKLLSLEDPQSEFCIFVLVSLFPNFPLLSELSTPQVTPFFYIGSMIASEELLKVL